MGYQHRNWSRQWSVYDTLDAASRADWDSLLAPTTEPHARGFQGGDIILDTTGMTELQLSGAVPPMLWEPRSPPCVLALTASGTIVPRRLVRFTANGIVAQATTPGDVYAGIAMNAALDGERVYVILLGTYPVECGPTPPSIGQPTSNDAQGRASISISGDDFAGITSSGMFSLGGVQYALVTISGTQRTTPFLLEFLPNPRIVLEADLGVTAPGGFCSNWADQSPNLNNATQPAGPQQWAYINDGSGPNGKPFMQGNAAQQRYMQIIPPVLASVQPANLTIFIVARWRAFSAFAAMMILTDTVTWQTGYGFSKANIIIPPIGRKQVSWLRQYNGVTTVPSPILNYGDWNVFEMWCDGVSLFQNVNGVLSGSVPFLPITYNINQKLSLGAGKNLVGFGFYYEGDFTTFSLDGTLGGMSAAQRSAARQYLGNKYNIPVVP